MKVKLDENFGRSVQKIFHDLGYDCRTVLEEKLFSAPDEEVLDAARMENRILVTMDHDFGNVISYPPEDTAGIAVINPPGRVSPSILRSLVLILIQGLKTRDIKGRLWIVEPGRIREHESDQVP